MGKKAFILFLCLNVLLIIAILYFLYTGFYHWETGPAWGSDPVPRSFTVRGDFLTIVCLAAIIPILLFVISRKHLWFLQTLAIVLIGAYWKTDILQQTLFVNQPSSTALESGMVKTFIAENEAALEGKVKVLNELMKESLGKTDGYKFVYESNDLAPYHKAVGLKGKTYSIFAIEFYNNKVKKLFLYIDFKGSVHHASELTFYPENFEEWEPLSNTKYPLGTNLMVVCERKYYYFGKKWILYFEGRCFG